MDDGFGDFISEYAEKIHFPRVDPRSRTYAGIPGRTVIGPVIEVHVAQLLDNHGLEIKIPSPNNPERTSWVVTCRGKNRFVNELHIPDPGHNLASSELLSEQALAKSR